MYIGARVRINKTYGDGAWNDKFYHYQLGTIVGYSSDPGYPLIIYLDEKLRAGCSRELEYVKESEVDFID